MATFNNLKDLFKHVEKQMQSTLKNEIAELVVETMQSHVQEDVYDVYEPVDPSKRRMYDGGLIDQDSIEIQVVDDNTISVENIAIDGLRNVPYIVESGQGYFSGASPILTRGRKFTEGTREELHNTDKLKQTMKNGLRKRGVKVD